MVIRHCVERLGQNVLRRAPPAPVPGGRCVVRCLAVLPLVPYPPDRGDRLRAWDMLTALAEFSELHVALVVREAADPAAEAALDGLARGVHRLPLSSREVWRGRVAGAVQGVPPGIAAYWSGRARRALVQECPGPWDLAVAFQLRSAPYAQALNARVRLLEMTDSLSLYRRRLPRRGRALAQRLALTGIERLERRLPRAFTACVVSAEEDADTVERLSGRRPLVVPNGTRPTREPRPYRTDGPLLFVGDMRYPPNEDGIVWFVRAVWPEVRRRIPDLTLRAVGRTTARVLRLGSEAGVEIAGYVADIGAEFDRALAVVNPVRYGSGTNRKVLDAWGAARPVLSTPAGVRGLPCRDGEHLVVAEAPGEWGAAVERLRGEPAYGEGLGEEGRALLLEVLRPSDGWRAACGRVLGEV